MFLIIAYQEYIFNMSLELACLHLIYILVFCSSSHTWNIDKREHVITFAGKILKQQNAIEFMDKQKQNHSKNATQCRER